MVTLTAERVIGGRLCHTTISGRREKGGGRQGPPTEEVYIHFRRGVATLTMEEAARLTNSRGHIKDPLRALVSGRGAPATPVLNAVVDEAKDT